MSKKKSIKVILFSLLLIAVGIVYMVIVTERIKTGWYLVHGSRKNRHGGLSACLATAVIFVGCYNLYRGMKGKGFRWEIDHMFSSYEDDSPYSCPYCGAKLEKGQFSCLICGKKII